MKIIGHRGAKGLAPENTLAAFREALKYKPDELEFDLRVTKDNTVVLHHNPEIASGAEKAVVIREHTLAQLQKIKPDLLTFKDFLKQVGNKTHLLVEIKPGEPVAPIAKLLQDQLKAGWKPGDFSIGSFDQRILVDMHRLFPDVEMIVIESWSGVRAALRARQVGTKRLNMKAMWLWVGFLQSMQRRGYQISPYTMNDPVKVRRWEPYLYGVVTDYPDRFRR